MKRYNILNNSLGWLCFVIAAVTYLMTLEPTASFWDCPEFILQGYKREIGHPPGNPIFMLAARFFTDFAFGDVTKVALMVNAMSGLLSAGTILLLFWTITHLVKRLVVKDDATEVSPLKMLVIFGSGLCGALMYAWSDTFWFSAVEGEVYAFSSFCTALVFWLILKWENRAEAPHSDKYLVFIAYIIGISIAVHLLNLLCIPAIVLVVYYKKFANPTGKGSLIALLVSFVIVGLILYGLVPGFIKMAQRFELMFVNGMGFSFNVGTLVYALVLVASFCWTIFELYRQKNVVMMKVSFLISVFFSGIFWIGHGVLIMILLLIALGVYLFTVKRLPVRILNVAAISILVIFVGYSSYALLLIRSSAHTPMNQNAPDNVFALASYLNREQYGDRPLIFGETFDSQPVRDESGAPIVKEGEEQYARKVKTSPDDKDEYIMYGESRKYVMSPELDMLFPRIYSSDPDHKQAYSDWIGGLEGNPVQATTYQDADGNSLSTETRIKPTFGENFRYFMNYQMNHMYWRYFMWNFAGRQNDIQGNGEVNHGNWISGIPFIDNPRLGDQSLLPYDEGEGNAGHNAFFLLPLIMGIIGLGWQAFTSKRGIEQFWVVFFLFFMTGIAIVIYLNQTPGQPRERDYAFAGSFYAYAIWVGMGVAGLWRLFCAALRDKKAPRSEAYEDPAPAMARKSMTAAVIAAVIGLIVPLQVVSQTWDDHDRSDRYAARDFGMNYLNSLDKNAIIFTYGDNDTFPLWYAQEVEGVRTDVKVVNTSYLTTDWYINQIRRPSYDSPGIALQATPSDYAYGELGFAYIIPQLAASDTVPALQAVKEIYSPEAKNNEFGVTMMRHPVSYIPTDLAQLQKAGILSPSDLKNPLFMPLQAIPLDFASNPSTRNGLYLNNIMALDMIATSAANGWNRPIYYAMTVPERVYMGLTPFMRSTGLALEVTPLMSRVKGIAPVNTDKAYRNVTEKFRWGGLDKVTAPGQIYLDETVRRMVTTHRSAMLDLATALANEGQLADSIAGPDAKAVEAFRADRYAKAHEVLKLIREKLPVSAMPYTPQVGLQIAELYTSLGNVTGNAEDKKIAREMLRSEIDRYTRSVLYYQSLSPSQYESLQNLDRYIDMVHFLDLINAYSAAGGDTDKLTRELSDKGVRLDRQLNYHEQMERAEQARKAQELEQEQAVEGLAED